MTGETPGASARRTSIHQVSDGKVARKKDQIAVEEPLEIRIGLADAAGAPAANLSVTMRTPGDDYALAAGFLFAEGVIRAGGDIARMTYCTGKGPGRRPQEFNSLQVDLRAGLAVEPRSLLRHFFVSASCGVCGKAAIEALRVRGFPPLPPGLPVVTAATVQGLPERLRAGQGVFEKTGGLHAAALFDAEGALLRLAEDVGRHNAVDKLVGAEVLAGRSLLHDRVLFVSGRTSFEIVQKALAAGVPILGGVGAPSSLAIGLAEEFGATLLGFVKSDRFNVYAGVGRVRLT
ncbi:MAG: formate dehydrogenase accessory sulfurtransferase FdhD [Planctomycetes bacterium]|nr:formate dehydrogenase accessory sulfurtransferase FdhD [Planctomycetota bacterium]